MVSFGILRTGTWLALFILVNGVHFARSLAADRNHKWSVDEPTAIANISDLGTTPLQYASHSEASVVVRDSLNHSKEEGRPRQATGKFPESTVANRSVSNIHSHRNASNSASKSSGNKTTANVNVSSTERASNDSMRSSTSNSAEVVNQKQTENTVRTTLCPNSSAEKETMRVEVEFASTLLENGLYYFIM